MPLAGMSKRVYSIGKLPDERKKTVAIIGTRRPTPYGIRTACDFAETLARHGIVVISGLAYGIDKAAHEGALRGGGVTVAVMAHGLDTIYPEAHTSLAEEIVKHGGALISPYPDGTPVHKYRFLERNQWVSGLADAILAIEAEERSGTQATVRYALDQGKEVFAIPGPIDSPQSRGPNRLIAEGAHCATSPASIIAIVDPHHQAHDTHATPYTPLERALADAPRTFEELCTMTRQESHALALELTQLELRGDVRRDETGRWQM